MEEMTARILQNQICKETHSAQMLVFENKQQTFFGHIIGILFISKTILYRYIRFQSSLTPKAF